MVRRVLMSCALIVVLSIASMLGTATPARAQCEVVTIPLLPNAPFVRICTP